jgi:hypothetical protein
MSGLRLDSPQGILAGGDSGPVVKPGDPDGSLLVQAVRQTDTPKMPPREAPSPPRRTDRMGPAGRVLAGDTDHGGRGCRRVEAALGVPTRPQPVPPTVKDAQWPRTGVDPFILARLEASG